MKKIILMVTFFVTTMTLNSQPVNTARAAKNNAFNQINDNLKEMPETPGNSFLAPDDLGTPPSLNWIKNFGGDGTDSGRDIITDISGNIYVTGWFSGAVNFNPTLLTSVGYVDAFVAKYSNTGVLIWVKQLSCNQYEIVKGLGITLDNSNNVYITGYFNGASLHAGNTTLIKSGKEDLFIAKYDAAGIFVFANHYGVSGQNRQGKCIAVDGDGNPFVINGGHDSYYYGGNCFTKFNTTGQFQWDFINGAYFNDIKITNAVIYLTGYFSNNVVFGSTTLTTQYTYQTAPFIAKCNSAGAFSWAVQGVPTGSSSIYNRSFSLAIDANENIYVAGRFIRTLSFGEFTLTTNTSYDYVPFLVKCNSSGTFEWAKQATLNYYINNNNDTRPVNIATDNNGNVYLTCELLNDTLSFGGYIIGGTGCCLVKYNSNGTEQLASKYESLINKMYSGTTDKISCTGTMAGNIFITQFDLQTIPQWTTQTSGNSGVSVITNLKTDKEGRVFLYGNTDVTTGLFGNTKGTFIAKIQPGGETLWSLPFTGGILYTGYGDFISLDNAGDVVVMGYFSDTLKIGNKTLINPNRNNVIFIVKIGPDGNVIWLKQVGSGPSSEGYSVTTDKLNNVIACGIFHETFTVGTSTLLDAGNGDAFLAKFDENGNVLWAQRAGGEETEYEAYASTDSLNNIYLSGEFTSRNITVDNFPLTLTQFDGDVLLARISPDGVVQWAYAYGGDPTGDEHYYRFYCWPTAIKTDAMGNSYLYGWTGKGNNYGPYFLESPYKFNFFLTKINSAGTVQWANIIKEKRYGWHSMQIDLDKNGNLFLGGNLLDTLYFDNHMVTNQGESDLFLGKYTTAGNLDWVKFFGSNPLGHNAIYNTRNDLNAIAVYDSASLFIGGKTVYDIQIGDSLLHSSASNGFFALFGPTIPSGSGNLPVASSVWSVYPNPANDKVTITVSVASSLSGIIHLYDPSGKLIKQIPTGNLLPGSSTIDMDVSMLPAGVYFLKFTGKGKSSSVKFVKGFKL